MFLSNHCAATHIYLFTLQFGSVVVLIERQVHTKDYRATRILPISHFLFCSRRHSFRFRPFAMSSLRAFSPPFRWQWHSPNHFVIICSCLWLYHRCDVTTLRRVCHVCIWYLLHDYCHFDWVEPYIFPIYRLARVAAVRVIKRSGCMPLSLSRTRCPSSVRNYRKINIVIELRQKWIKLLNDFLTRALGFGWLNITFSSHFRFHSMYGCVPFLALSEAKTPPERHPK